MKGFDEVDDRAVITVTVAGPRNSGRSTVAHTLARAIWKDTSLTVDVDEDMPEGKMTLLDIKNLDPRQVKVKICFHDENKKAKK